MSRSENLPVKSTEHGAKRSATGTVRQAGPSSGEMSVCTHLHAPDVHENDRVHPVSMFPSDRGHGLLLDRHENGSAHALQPRRR